MVTVGIRELKNRLSEYLRMVRRGEAILVTDRGEVVAELRQPGVPGTAADSGLARHARAGKARIGAPNLAAEVCVLSLDERIRSNAVALGLDVAPAG